MWNKEEGLMARILTAMFASGTDWTPEDWDDGVEATAHRFIAYLDEFRPANAPQLDFTTFEGKKSQLVVCQDIEFSSICRHHLLPFLGVVHIGYIPNKLTVGLSKLPRLVNFWANRPQTQEDLTARLVTELDEKLNPVGVMVVIKSTHTCMSCRGVRKVGATMTTSLPKGMLFSSQEARNEFLSILAL